MLKRLALLLFLFALVFTPAATARASDPSSAAGATPETGLPPDGVPRPLAPNSILWYQFNYAGDRSLIEVRLLDGGAPDIQLAVYTPEQMEFRQRGDDPKPIGQMHRAHGQPDVELHWAGNFNRGGTYFVSVNNPSDLAHMVRLVVLGAAVYFPHTTIQQIAPPAATDGEAAAVEPVQPVAFNVPAAPLPPSLTATAVPVEFPESLGMSTVSIPLTARPASCTPAAAMPAQVTRNLALCPNQVYAPFHVTGNNLTVYGDPTALVEAPPRGFGITVTGSNVALVGLRVAGNTHPADMNKWLCLFDACSYDTMYQKETVRGGIGYGGGILLENSSNASVIHSTVWGGTIGVAAVRSHSSKIVGSTLSSLNGWGVYLQFTDKAIVAGNISDDVNRPCVGPDGFYYQSGCESAAYSCVGCQNSVIVSNSCARAGNCFYATGDGGLPSNANKFFHNHCAGASNNCFEITFSHDNQFDYNVATSDPVSGRECAYPFWIAGSIVFFGRHNDWACTRAQKRAHEESQNSTNSPTEIRGL
jgi:hypothetical protein